MAQQAKTKRKHIHLPPHEATSTDVANILGIDRTSLSTALTLYEDAPKHLYIIGKVRVFDLQKTLDWGKDNLERIRQVRRLYRKLRQEREENARNRVKRSWL